MQSQVVLGGHFLLVEDDDAHAMMVEMAFADGDETGATLERVCDAEHARIYLEQRAAYTDRPRPDVIVLDLKMDGMDGFDLLSFVKQDDRFRDIPVVILTTSDADTDRRRAMELHANSYLVKPVGFNAFCSLVQDMKQYWSHWHARDAQRRPDQLPLA